MSNLISEDKATNAKPFYILVLAVLVPFGLGYYMSYLFRTINAIISPQLVSDVGMTPAALGLMTAVYFITLATVQLPLGIALDRYGPRKVQSTLSIITAAGALVFALGTDLLTLTIGRGLIGLGVSGCLMAALKANVIWFSRSKIPIVNGVIFAFGTAGALTTTVPLELLIREVDWRLVFFCLAGIAILSGLVIFFLVPQSSNKNSSEPSAQSSTRSQIADLKLVYGSRYFWRLSMMVALHWGVFLAYQALWVAPWLRDVALLGRSDVAETMLIFNIGMLAGVLSIGVFAELLQRLGIQPVVPLIIGTILSIIVQGMFALAWTDYPSLLCFLFGYFGSTSTLVYAVLNQKFPNELAGRVNTAQNMLIFITSFGIQWVAGVIIGLFPAPSEGLYSAEGHQMAIFTFISLEVLGVIFFLWPRKIKQ